MSRTIVTPPAARWDTSRYMRMVGVRLDDGQLAVAFEDGARVRVDVARLVPDPPPGLRWADLRFDGYEVVVPSGDGDVEIPWLAIRRLTDAGFSDHLGAAFDAEKRTVGRRVWELRRARGLDRETLAARAGVAPDLLERAEAGEETIGLPTLERLLGAMDHGLDDLLPEPTVAARG